MRVVVVGAGILGSSTAYHLAREGAEVTLVDRADEGRATAAGAGIVCPWGSLYDDPPSYALLAGGARYYAKLVAALAEDGEQDLGYARVGGLYVPETGEGLDAAERLCQTIRQGIESRHQLGRIIVAIVLSTASQRLPRVVVFRRHR